MAQLTLNKNLTQSMLLGNKEKASNRHNKNIFFYQKNGSNKCK